MSSSILRMSMASSAIFHLSSSLSFSFSTKVPRPAAFSLYTKSLTVAASTSLDYTTDKSSVSSKASSWQWKFKDNSIKIHYEEHEAESNAPTKNILLMPTISDVSTVEEWRLVAKDIIQRSGKQGK